MKKNMALFLVALSVFFLAPVFSQTLEPPVYSPEGCVVEMGLPAAPMVAKAGAGVLTFTFNSPQQPWISAELDSLQSWLSKFVPVMETVYGPPAFSLTINVVKDSTIAYAGLYFISEAKIVLNVSTQAPLELRLDVLLHETGHAFRDILVLHPSWEEGMVRALEIEVHRILGWPHWDTSHSYTYDVWYEALNEPDIGGTFFGALGLGFLRYQAAGYAWKKVFLEAEDFFRDFNASLQADPTFRGDEQRLIGLVASIAPTVEGEPFVEWYSRQYVFATSAPQGRRLHNRINQFSITAFTRSGVVETNIVGAPVHWSIFDFRRALVDSGTVVTTLYGVAGYRPDPAKLVVLRGSGTVILEIPDAVPDTAFRYFGAEPGLEHQDGVFGVIEGGHSGNATVTCLDDSTEVVANVVNGAFAIPELASKRGRFMLRFRNTTLVGTRYFNKDGSAYYVYVPSRLLVTPVTQTPASTPSTFFLAQNYPNPFNPTTHISFFLATPSQVSLKVFDLLGRKVKVLVDDEQPAGQHSVAFDATGLPSGVYFYRLRAGEFVSVRRMTLMK